MHACTQRLYVQYQDLGIYMYLKMCSMYLKACNMYRNMYQDVQHISWHATCISRPATCISRHATCISRHATLVDWQNPSTSWTTATVFYRSIDTSSSSLFSSPKNQFQVVLHYTSLNTFYLSWGTSGMGGSEIQSTAVPNSCHDYSYEKITRMDCTWHSNNYGDSLQHPRSK